MARRTRRAVSTYIEVFILMAVVLAGSTLVYVAATSLASSSQGGAAVQINFAAIKQGAGVAVETMTIVNTGTVTVTSFTMTTAGVISAAACYLSILNPTTGSTTSQACSFAGPVSLGGVSLPAGQSVIATATIDANLFTAGTRYTVLVSASPAAQATVQVVAGSG